MRSYAVGMEFSEKLRNLIALRKLSQAQLGEHLGVHQTRISKWISGEGRPTLFQGLALARALSVPLDYLADDTQDDPPPPEITPEERVVLSAIRKLGIDEAMWRLVAGEPAAGPGAAEGGDRPIGGKHTTAEEVEPGAASRPKRKGSA